MSIQANNTIINDVKYNGTDINIVNYIDKNGAQYTLWTRGTKVTFMITNEIDQHLGKITCQYTDINGSTKNVVIKESTDVDYSLNYSLTDIKRNSTLICNINVVGGRRGAGTMQDPYQYVYLKSSTLKIDNIRPDEQVTQRVTGEVNITGDTIIGIQGYWAETF